MKKMKNRDKETNGLIMALKMAAACAGLFVAIAIAIPARIMLDISSLMAGTAINLTRGKSEVIQKGMSDEEIIAEIADV